MKTLALLAVVLMFCSACASAGEYLMNDTGETVTALRVVFSEPIRISSFGDVLLSVNPLGESIEFTFSGGELEAWGGHWLNWEPASAMIIDYHWTWENWVSEQVSGVGYADCDTWAPLQSVFGGQPSVPSPVSDIIYGYLNQPRRCGGSGPFQVPVYISIPYQTPAADKFSIRPSNGGTVALFRADEIW